VLAELYVVEQRYQAVLEMLHQGVSVTDVARRFGGPRQTVHRWLRLYAIGGLGALADRSSRPGSCPHQIDARVEARIVELRREHFGWGPRSIETQLRREGVVPLPGRPSIYRALIRHKLIEPARRRREDCKRWERSKAMELWQMDVTGGVYLADGTELKAVTGIDDRSRFCVCPGSFIGRRSSRSVHRWLRRCALVASRRVC
jgi:transposase-like protein